MTTLIELDQSLDRGTRLQILGAMQETAKRLESAVLHPEVRGVEERQLQPVPQLSEQRLAELLRADAVRAEQHFRDINEQLIGDFRGSSDHELDVFCECWAMDCTDRVRVPLADYFAIHKREDQFVICPGHVLPSVEHVVERTDDRWVVRKLPEAMQAAKDVESTQPEAT